MVLLLFSQLSFAQELHHQMISSQGSSVQLDSGVFVSQTIGQQSMSGTSSDASLKVLQGFQQSNWNSIIQNNPIQIDIDISYFPNPVTDFLNFRFTNLESADLQFMVIDFAGRSLINKKIAVNESMSSVDLSMLPSGSYLIYLRNNTIKFYKKIIKK